MRIAKGLANGVAKAGDNIPSACGLRVTQNTGKAPSASARADSLAFRAGRPHALTAFAFTRYALQRGRLPPTPWGHPRRGGAPRSGPAWTAVRWSASLPPPDRGAPLRLGCGLRPHFRPGAGAPYFGWGRNSKAAPPCSSAWPPRAWPGRPDTHFVGPSSIESGASMAALVMLTSLAGATHFNAQRTSKRAVAAQINWREMLLTCFLKSSTITNIANGYRRFAS